MAVGGGKGRDTWSNVTCYAISLSKKLMKWPTRSGPSKQEMTENRNGNAPPANGKAHGAGSAYTINLVGFSTRLKALYSNWREHKAEFWGSSDVLAVATPPASEDLRYLKSSALNIWLLGYEFPDTIMIFMNKQIHFLCSQKKASLLEAVKKAAVEAVGVEVVMHVKARNDDGTAQMDSILLAIRAQSKSDPIVGYIAREAPEGILLETWAEKLKNSNLQLADITNGFSDLFAVKDHDEVTNVKKAAFLTASVMKNFVVPKLEKVIDEEKKVAHSALMDETEKAILDPTKIKVKLKADNVDICYPPIFQSGGNFDLRPSASSDDEFLYYDSASVIICAVGSRYSSYCSNIARTFLIDSTETQSKAYDVLLGAHEAAIGALNPGNKVSAVYQAALSVVERDAPDLVANLTKSAGTGIGLEFRESGLSLNAKNDRVLKPGMVFNVTLGFQNLQAQTKNPKSQNFSLLLADTVIVTEKGHEVATVLSSKSAKDVAYSFNEDEEEEELPKVKSEAGTENLYSKATLRSDNNEISKEELRRQHQAELARQKNEETARRLAGGGSVNGDKRGASKNSSDLIAYKSVNDLPPPRDLMIQIDQKNEAILLPVYGSMVPFHVSTVKTVSSQQDTSRSCYIRIIFNVPGTPFNPHDAHSLKHQGAIFLKEVSFRSKDPRHISEVVQQIKTLRRNVLARESERAERATLVSQEKLVIGGNKFKPIRLIDLWIRPTFGGRARKLRHAFFQPAEKEMITLLHFHLHNHIMVGNKKTKDVQFYVEKNFDMAIVFKDFKRDVLRIDSIPSTSLDGIKEWLDTTDLKYYESRLNLNWRPILKTITDDPERFLEDGGWEFLNLEASDSDSDNSEESDQGYEPSDAEPDSVSEDEESDSASLVESEEDDEEEDSEEASEEEKGKTWEELEREASNADREKGDESDSDEERKRRKMKAFGKSRAGPSSAAPKRAKMRR
ncbi:hypothetical protein C3L33_21408, partial [Rhododendron williamsianum]